MSQPVLIRSEPFPGGVENFNALMERLFRYTVLWSSTSGEEMSGLPWPRGRPTRYAWLVLYYSDPLPDPGDPGRSAGIEVYEERHGHSVVEFRDCFDPLKPAKSCLPIGPAFEELCEVIVSEMRSTSPTRESTGAGEAAPSLPKHFPKRPETLEKYREAYEIVVDLREIYRQGYDILYEDNPTPRIDDYREALVGGMGWKRCAKIVRRVIKFGDAGLLK